MSLLVLSRISELVTFSMRQKGILKELARRQRESPCRLFRLYSAEAKRQPPTYIILISEWIIHIILIRFS